MPNAPVAAAASGLPIFSRRSVLTGVACVLAAPAAAAAAAPACELDELVSDHRWATAAYEQAWEHCDRTEAAAILPEVQATHGLRRHVATETGEIEWRPWVFLTKAEIDWYFDAHPIWNEAMRQGVARNRSSVLDELERSRSERRSAEDAAGITAARAAKKAAWDQRRSIEIAIFAYAPTTIAAVREKNAFLLEMLRDGHDFDEDLEAIFSAFLVA